MLEKEDFKNFKQSLQNQTGQYFQKSSVKSYFRDFETLAGLLVKLEFFSFEALKLLVEGKVSKITIKGRGLYNYWMKVKGW